MFSFQRGGGSIDLLFAGSSPSQGPAGQVTRGALSASWLRPAPPPPHPRSSGTARSGARGAAGPRTHVPPCNASLRPQTASRHRSPGFAAARGSRLSPGERGGAGCCSLGCAGPNRAPGAPSPLCRPGGGGFPPLHPGCNSCPAAVSQRSCGSGQGVQEGSGVPGHGALPGAAGGCAWGERSRARLCCRLASSGGSG